MNQLTYIETALQCVGYEMLQILNANYVYLMIKSTIKATVNSTSLF